MSKKILRICAVVWGISGIIILVSTLYPIVSYERSAKKEFPKLISSRMNEEDEESKANLDYTRASNWFTNGKEKNDFSKTKVKYYQISVPALGIKDATVSIGGEDLAESLIQYPGTSHPGKIGNAVIFGHSILPYFFDPKDYLAIFSTLPNLRNGNTIFIEYDGITYKYIVESAFEATPEDLQILEQSRADSYITLVTCTPPGHPSKPKRLIVRAKLAPITKADANSWY